MTSAEPAPEVLYHEESAEPVTADLPLADLSVDLGVPPSGPLSADPDALNEHLERVAPWAATARSTAGRDALVSTCLLVDDYGGDAGAPDKVIPELQRVAARHGLAVDYIGRGSGMVDADAVPLARMVESHLVGEPSPGTDGVRPPASVSGWLSNGERSPATWISGPAMGVTKQWQPPRETTAGTHSIFVDVQLWDEEHGARHWSPAFVAAVWQLLRLGLLRYLGEPVAQARRWHSDLPDRWDRLPPVTRLTDDPAPFAARRTVSIRPSRGVPTEHGMRTIIDQVALDSAAVRQVGLGGEGSWDLADRIVTVVLAGSG